MYLHKNWSTYKVEMGLDDFNQVVDKQNSSFYKQAMSTQIKNDIFEI